MILTQTWAILVDAYRELNAKRLFWITMGLSLIVVLAFAAIGLNEEGISILFWTIPIEAMNSRVFEPAEFYKLTFVSLGIQIWLTWVATILALVSTTSMIPDMLASGSIELVLARPISRARLFLTKYIVGLLFVFLQVLVFATASFLVIGIRGGAWEPGLFLAVPVVTLFFSYLFGLCALFGVVTRSAIASLLLTLLVWFLTFALHTTETILLAQKLEAGLSAERHELVISETKAKVQELSDELVGLEARAEAGEIEKDASDITKLRSRIDTGKAYIKRIETDAPRTVDRLASMAKWHRVFFAVKTVLPKTSETTELLRRWLVNLANLPSANDDDEPADKDLDTIFGTDDQKPSAGDAAPARKKPRSVDISPQEIQKAIAKEIDSRSPVWVIGTSLGFEAACVAIATFLFWRRDF